MTHLLTLLCSFLLTFPSHSQETETKVLSFDEAFKAGVALYQEKKYQEASNSFKKALEFKPKSVNTLTNLALSQFQIGEKGWAIALLRKSLTIEPSLLASQQALKFILPQLDVKDLPHDISFWDQLRTQVLIYGSVNWYFALTALLFFATGWLWIRFSGEKRRAAKEERASPQVSWILVLITLLFPVFIFLTAAKFYDHLRPRGTIVLAKISAKTAPAEQSPALFDLFAGLEVNLEATEADWVQVTYPGAMTGWIPKSAVMQTSGRELW